MKSTNILVDTNVILNDFFGRKGNAKDKKRFALTSAKAGFSLNRLANNNMYIASFSVVQLISLLQKNKYPVYTVESELNHIITKYRIVSLEEKDFMQCADNIHGMVSVDIEDNLIYGLATKAKCFYILTDNAADFAPYVNIKVIKPGKSRLVYD